MGLKITPKFTNSDIESIINDRKERILAAAISRLQVVGEKFVTNARNNGAYKDRTGNLRSSAGYVIIKDGKQLFENFQAFPQKDPKAEGAGQGVSQAQKTAAEVAEKIIGKYPTGLILIGVAGMDYAAAVESKGFDVITSSAMQAKTDLETGLAELKSKIAQIP
jgi:hypothetical protein